METTTFGKEFLKELEAEASATRKCLERIPESMYDWKPHEKSMKMGYLALIIAEIPNWLTIMLRDGVIDFATFKHPAIKSGAEFAQLFDQNMAEVRTFLEAASDKDMEKMFELKNAGHLLMSSPIKDSISSSINHLVHHRGQLTVYMRLNDIPVPSLYGPSADENTFK